jgi:hypothetical protein
VHAWYVVSAGAGEELNSTLDTFQNGIASTFDNSLIGRIFTLHFTLLFLNFWGFNSVSDYLSLPLRVHPLLAN